MNEEEEKVRSIPRLSVAFLLILSACAAPIPSASPTSVATPLVPTSTNVPKSTLTGQIVYSNEDDIYVMNLTDSHVTRLTNDPEWDFDAAWSPEGTKKST
jgi:hypothetical protein